MTGDEIKALREELGMSQQEFSHLFSVMQHHVSRWEASTNGPKGKHQRTLAEVERRKEWLIERLPYYQVQWMHEEPVRRKPSEYTNPLKDVTD